MLYVYCKHIVFKETAESIVNILKMQGHKYVILTSTIQQGNHMHILFGAHELLCEPPEKYIVYNLEQTMNVTITPEYNYVLQHAVSVLCNSRKISSTIASDCFVGVVLMSSLIEVEVSIIYIMLKGFFILSSKNAPKKKCVYIII